MTPYSSNSMLLCVLALTLLFPIAQPMAGDNKPKIDFDPPVHIITVPHDEPYLPEGPGYKEFVTHCTICHSPRYVSNQPPLSRQTWTKEVAKMRNEYGAPIPEQMVQPIIDYLMFFNGKEVLNVQSH